MGKLLKKGNFKDFVVNNHCFSCKSNIFFDANKPGRRRGLFPTRSNLFVR